jgi:hypothetical protein
MGKDPLAGADFGYELWKKRDTFVAVQLRQAAEASGFTLPLVDAFQSNEKEAEFLEIDSEGKLIKSMPATVIVEGEGSLRSRLTAVYELQSAGPGGPAQYLRKSLNTDDGTSEQMEVDGTTGEAAEMDPETGEPRKMLPIIVGLSLLLAIFVLVRIATFMRN